LSNIAEGAYVFITGRRKDALKRVSVVDRSDDPEKTFKQAADRI
jgi:hypothetical protein